ncbi:MAG TPA: hypothetical protein VMW25_01515 [Clostridia bacterium]|nr:hypothetical protein [Clostridia bacterium]
MGERIASKSKEKLPLGGEVLVGEGFVLKMFPENVYLIEGKKENFNPERHYFSLLGEDIAGVCSLLRGKGVELEKMFPLCRIDGVMTDVIIIGKMRQRAIKS